MALADLRRLAAEPVTHVTRDPDGMGHTLEGQKTAESRRAAEPVTHVTRVTHKLDKGGAHAEGDAAPRLAPASPEQAAAERQDREAIAAEGAPAAMMPLDAETLAAWEVELAGLLLLQPAQRITDPARAATYFAAEARRRLAQVKHDRHAAGLLLGFWRHAREART